MSAHRAWAWDSKPRREPGLHRFGNEHQQKADQDRGNAESFARKAEEQSNEEDGELDDCSKDNWEQKFSSQNVSAHHATIAR
jgi:hypothetical protein